MGLFSDILEANRDRGYDPTMVIGSGGLKYCCGSSYVSHRTNSIRRNVEAYHRSFSDISITPPVRWMGFAASRDATLNRTIVQKKTAEQQRILNEIKKDLLELELVKVHHIVVEKVALWIKKQGNIECIIVKDILEEIISQSIDTYRYLEDMKKEIGEDIIDQVKYDIPSVDEQVVKNDILNTIVESLGYALENGLEIDRYLFKKMVKDVGVLIHELIPDEVNEDLTDKKQVEMYFGTQCKVVKGIGVCQNCGQPLFKTIPYCFNCYDGKESIR